MATCPDCDGEGTERSFWNCGRCDGTGEVESASLEPLFDDELTDALGVTSVATFGGIDADEARYERRANRRGMALTGEADS